MRTTGLKRTIRNAFFRLGLHSTARAVVHLLRQQGVQVDGRRRLRLAALAHDAARPAQVGRQIALGDDVVAHDDQALDHVPELANVAGPVVRLQVTHLRFGQAVSAEVNPWCFWLGNDWSAIERLGSYALSYYVAPHHSDAVYDAFRDGTVDIMATDHAPHTEIDKDGDFDSAPFGIVGRETALGVYLKALVEPGHLTLRGLIARMTVEPIWGSRRAASGMSAPMKASRSASVCAVAAA